MKLKWNLPGPDAPGFLKRRREISALLDVEPTPANLDKINEYLTQYIEGPKDEALAALEGISKREYGQAIMSLLGYDFDVSEKKDGKSGGL
jgi:hypothetical protein